MFILGTQWIRLLQKIVIWVLSKKASSRKLFFDTIRALDLINGLHLVFKSIVDAHALLKFIHKNILGDIQLLYFCFLGLKHVWSPALEKETYCSWVWRLEISVESLGHKVVQLQVFYLLFLLLEIITHLFVYCWLRRYDTKIDSLMIITKNIIIINFFTHGCWSVYPLVKVL